MLSTEYARNLTPLSSRAFTLRRINLPSPKPHQLPEPPAVPAPSPRMTSAEPLLHSVRRMRAGSRAKTVVADGGASLMSPEKPIDFQRP